MRVCDKVRIDRLELETVMANENTAPDTWKDMPQHTAPAAADTPSDQWGPNPASGKPPASGTTSELSDDEKMKQGLKLLFQGLMKKIGDGGNLVGMFLESLFGFGAGSDDNPPEKKQETPAADPKQTVSSNTPAPSSPADPDKTRTTQAGLTGSAADTLKAAGQAIKDANAVAADVIYNWNGPSQGQTAKDPAPAVRTVT